MGVPASVGFRTAAQVMSCIECHECLNACWYYPETTYIAGEGMTENPYAGRCRNCGSRKIVIGEISILEMQKWERQGWEFIPGCGHAIGPMDLRPHLRYPWRWRLHGRL